MFLDFDELGPAGAVALLENARYPNHIMGPVVMDLEEREVEFSDDHPLNSGATRGLRSRSCFVNRNDLGGHGYLFWGSYLLGVGATIYAQVSGNGAVGGIGLVSLMYWLYGWT